MVNLIAALSLAGLKAKTMAVLATVSGLVVAYIVIFKLRGGPTLAKLVGGLALGVATVAVVAASPQLGKAAFEYGTTSLTGDLRALFTDAGGTGS